MLPFYRGRNILNWVLINDESEFGITVHHVDEGIDTGDIIIQKAFPISEKDNLFDHFNFLLDLLEFNFSNLDSLKPIFFLTTHVADDQFFFASFNKAITFLTCFF